MVSRRFSRFSRFLAKPGPSRSLRPIPRGSDPAWPVPAGPDQVRIRFVDLINGHHDRYKPAARECSIASMVCGMTPSSGSNYQTNDVGCFGAACTHQGERLMTRGIQKHYPARFTRMIRTRHRTL